MECGMVCDNKTMEDDEAEQTRYRHVTDVDHALKQLYVDGLLSQETLSAIWHTVHAESAARLQSMRNDKRAPYPAVKPSMGRV